MEPAEYEVMFRNEDAHWWYWGLRDLLLPIVAERAKGQGGAVAILDAGCGTGKHLDALRRMGTEALGVELAPSAFEFLRRRGLDGVARASIGRVPFPDQSFDVVLSTDVVCCIEPPGDGEALRELARVLKPGGWLVLNLPAYPMLRSSHDEAVHIRRRFTRGSLRGLLADAGLRVRTLTYRNTLLFPIAATVRLARRGAPAHSAKPASDLAPLPGPVNGLLKLPLSLENRWIRRGGRLPFGLSVFCVAVKP